MSRKRKLDATLPAEEAPEGPAVGGIGGFWGGSATNLLQSRLREVQQSMADSILHGITAIEIEPGQITDEVGSDRQGDWQAEEGFRLLVADMARRGQRQPIRVRPVDPDWRPSGELPFAGTARFVLQSGRRRLAAAQSLGRPVMAVISTDMGDRKLADLEERFLENTMRKDLSGFEQLLSIGLIAQAHQDLSQAEIAERIGVPPGDVSLGLSCVELHDRIIAAVDVAHTPKRKFRELIPALRGPEGKRGRGRKPAKPVVEGAPEAEAAPAVEPAREVPRVLSRRAGSLSVETRATGDGLVLTVKGRAFGFMELERLSMALAQVLEREAGGQPEGEG